MRSHRKLRISLYSNGAIGRLQADQCLAYINAFKGLAVGELPTQAAAKEWLRVDTDTGLRTRSDVRTVVRP